MNLDVRTLLALWVINALLLGGIQLGVWLYQREDRVLVQWGLANFICGVASALLALRGYLPDWISVGLGNALFVAWLMLVWSGMRAFCGLPTSPLWTWAVPALLFLAMQVPPLRERLDLRTVLLSLAVAGATAATAYDLWRAQRTERLVLRRFLIVVFATTAVAAAWRAIDSFGLQPDGSFMRVAGTAQAFLLYNNLFVVLWNVGALLMVNERLQQRLTRLATHDALTGVLNARAFFEYSEQHLAATRVRNTDIAVLVVGLRHLHAYNHHLGHPAVDDCLRRTAQLLGGALRSPHDQLCRLGGEQFAVLLADCSADAAAQIAEQLCERLDREQIPHPGAPLGRAAMLVGIRAGKALEFTTLRSAVEQGDTALLRTRTPGEARIAVFLAPETFVPPWEQAPPSAAAAVPAR